MANPLSDLPHGLTEPLRYLEPFPWLWIAAAAAAIAPALLLSAWWWRRRRPGTSEAPSPPPAIPDAAPVGLTGELDRLRRRHLAAESYRSGCHELAAFLRGHLESSRGRPFSRWTAPEARRAEGDTMWTRLLSLVAELQFARGKPRRSDFEGACDLARDALATRGRG